MSTIPSVPEASNSAPVDAVPTNPLTTELIEAAEALAKRWIVNERATADAEPLTICLVCGRGSLHGVLDHADRCQIGNVVRAVEKLKLRRAGCVCHRGTGTCSLHGDVAALPEPSESDAKWMGTREKWKTAERRVVCGAHWTFGREPGLPMTCDKEVGHDTDPRSDHYNADARFSWPTAALIEQERLAVRA